VIQGLFDWSRLTTQPRNGRLERATQFADLMMERAPNTLAPTMLSRSPRKRWQPAKSGDGIFVGGKGLGQRRYNLPELKNFQAWQYGRAAVINSSGERSAAELSTQNSVRTPSDWQ